MRTIETIAVVEAGGTLTLQLPPDIPPGEHRIVLVIEEQPVILTKQPARSFPIIKVSTWPEDLPLRREDLYDDSGR